MDLSHESQLIELRRRFTDDAAHLAGVAEGTADQRRADILHGKAAYAVTALRYMDELERVDGPIA